MNTNKFWAHVQLGAHAISVSLVVGFDGLVGGAWRVIGGRRSVVVEFGHVDKRRRQTKVANLHGTVVGEKNVGRLQTVK